ncbi:MAG: hypothetical protein HKP27_08150 [Myxococcales bacterium]|nr:hypothetical protein [Myxococcales bacterium]
MSEPSTQDQTAHDHSDDAPGGKVDLVAVLYILGGIPAMTAFFVILFALVRMFPGIPA